jgi:hypothetical protein
MTARPVTAAHALLYSLTVLAGILLMPLALLMRRAGVTLPIDAVLERVPRP